MNPHLNVQETNYDQNTSKGTAIFKGNADKGYGKLSTHTRHSMDVSVVSCVYMTCN